MSKLPRVAVLGATGAVGQEFIRLFEERDFQFASLKLLASKRSAGKKMMVKGKEYTVEEAKPESFENIDIALFAGGSISKTLAPEAAKRGAVVIDNSSTFRMDPEVPLVIPEINPEDIAKHKGIIANPNCSTIIMLMALKPIYDISRIKRIIVSTYQAVSGAGKDGIDELLDEAAAIAKGETYEPKILPSASLPKHYQIAYNVIPQIDVFLDNEYTKEEMKMVNETHKIFHDDTIAITPTAVRVPVIRSHAESIYIETERPLSTDEVKKAVQGFKGAVLVDDIKNNPVFKKRNLDEEDIPNTKTVMVEPAVENQQISLFDEALCESKVKSYQDLNNENVVENLFAEYQKAFVKKVAPKKSESDSGQMSIFDYFANDDEKETNDGTASDHKMTQTGMGTDAVDTSFTVHQGDASLQIDLQKSSGSKNVLPYAKQEFIKKVEELKKVAISVPKIGISYSSTITFKSFTVKRNIMDFDVATSRIERYDAVNGKLLQVLDADALIVENPENMLAVSLLESIPEFSSDDAEFILEVVDQYLALIEGTDEEKKKIVRRYATVIVEDLRKQIYASKEESTEFVFNVQKDLIVFKSFAKNMKENGRLNFKKEVPDKKNIKQYLFEGYKKSYYAENAFDSDDERRLSVVLEEDSEVIRFIKPPLNQLGLFYKAAKQYNPDFLVETADKKYMIEVKAANQTDNEDVQEKAKAAIKWCECASQVDADGKTWEYRLVPGDKIIVGNTFKYVIGMAIPVVVDGE